MGGIHFQLSFFVSQIEKKLIDVENIKSYSIVKFAYSTSYFEYIHVSIYQMNSRQYYFLNSK